MSDLIRRQDAIEVIDAVLPVDPMKSEYAQGVACGAALAKIYVEQLPSAQPERKKGKWILHENQRQEDVDNGNYLYVCSECGKSDIHAKTQEVPFCWWCGSEMREDD